MKLAKWFSNVVVLQVALSATVFCVTASISSSDDLNNEGSGVLNASVSDGSDSSISSSSLKFSDESTGSNHVQTEGPNVPPDTLPVTEIHSSFGEVTKPSVPKENAAVNERPQVLLNQGTVSEDFSESGTVGILSSTDSATAELKNRVVSMSANFNGDIGGDETPNKNSSSVSPPPIIILPPGDSGSSHSFSGEEPQHKTSSSSLPTSDHNQASEAPQPPVVRAEPKVVLKSKETENEQDMSTISVGNEPATNSLKASEQTTPAPPSTNDIDLVGVPTSESPHEEIPSFSEWTQKQLEEAERKKGQNKTTSSSPTRVSAPSKLRTKNYASPDCGAKIVAANPEAENPSGVLSSSKDEYVLNKCSTQRKWLIIELCEPIQAKKLELANFELFSSSPKDFSVSLSHNYPSREWSSIGQFTARDERAAQSFNLHPHLFGKFLKVEFNTHYGHEHFCCTSQIRIFGTSEFEVLETESEAQDLEDAEEDEDEQPIGADMGKPSKNLFGHATEAVYSIVKKAAEALVKSGDHKDQSSFLKEQNFSVVVPEYSKPPAHCTTLRHLVVCNNCSEDFFDRVYELLSCRPQELQTLISTPFVLDAINSSQLCSVYGLDFILKRSGSVPLRIKHEDQLDHAGYLAAMLPAEYISALCNILAVLEGKVVLNDSHSAAFNRGINLTIGPPEGSKEIGFKKLVIEPDVAPTCSMKESFSSSHCKSQTDGAGVQTTMPGSSVGTSQHPTDVSMIRPTKTLSKDEDKLESFEPSRISHDRDSVSLSSGTSETPVVVESSLFTVQPSAVERSSVERRSFSTDSSSNGPPSSILSEIPTLEPPIVESPVREASDAGDGLDSGSPEDPEHSKDLDAIIQEMKALDNNEESSSESNPPLGGTTIPSSIVTQTRTLPQQAQKESVFLRLSNRIKALERNMSLSGQYLEELSRRYKKQEELSRALNKTLVLLHEEVRRSREKEAQRDNDMNFLKERVLELSTIVESLHAEQDSWQQKAAVVSQHLIVIVIEVAMFSVVLWICRRLPSDSLVSSSSPPSRKISSVFCKLNRPHGKPKRRSSFEEIRSSKHPKSRRPSEELLYIAGPDDDLPLKDNKVVVVEGVDLSPGADTSSWSAVCNKDHRRKRKRKKDLCIKSSSSENLVQLVADDSSTRKISAPCNSSFLITQHSIDNSSLQEPVQLSVVPRQPNSSNFKEPSAKVSESALTYNSLLTETEDGVADVAMLGTFPTFMETASSARSRRSLTCGEIHHQFIQPTQTKTEAQLHSESDLNNLNGHDGGSTVSHLSSQSREVDDQTSEHTSSQSDGQDAFITGVDKKKKIGKKGGLKSIVKKFF